MNLRSSLAVFGYILIGAAATGLGTGFFLYQANADRAELMERKVQAELQAEELLEASKQIADEANQKLERASEEVAKTRAQLQALEDERRMIKDATPLARASATNRWDESLNIPMGVGLRIPTRAEEIRNDDEALIVGTRTDAEPWLHVMPWSAEMESSLFERIQNPEESYYLVSGMLFVAKKGSLPESDDMAYAVRVQSAGTSTLLIWAKEDRGFDSDDIVDALSTFTFRS